MSIIASIERRADGLFQPATVLLNLYKSIQIYSNIYI